MRYRIETELQASFAEPVREHHVQLRLVPGDDEWQKVGGCTFDIDPVAEPIRHRDGFGNPVYCLAVMAAHSQLAIKICAEVETLLTNPFDYQPIAHQRERDWLQHSLRQAPRLWDFVLHRSALTPGLPQIPGDSETPPLLSDKPLIEQMQTAMEWVETVCPFDPESLDVQPELVMALESGHGSSVDLAHLLIAVVRNWGIPARFAMGYVDPDFFEPDEEDEDLQPLAQSMRAWADVLIPGAGWRGFDPAEGLIVNDTYVRVAIGRDADDVPRRRTAFKGGSNESEHRLLINVSRVS